MKYWRYAQDIKAVDIDDVLLATSGIQYYILHVYWCRWMFKTFVMDWTGSTNRLVETSKKFIPSYVKSWGHAHSKVNESPNVESIMYLVIC